MQVRPSELEIPPNDPFQNDALNRKRLEPPLTQFITQAVGPFVLALDGAWGSGKTTFLKMWQFKLQEMGHVCLYLNAWRSDFVEDPLISVVGELSETIENLENKDEKSQKLKKQIAEAKRIAGAIAKRSIPAAIKLATLGALDTEAVVEKVAADLVADLAKDRIDDYEAGKSEIKKFRESLTSLSLTLQGSQSDQSAKLVIIIDELDRCRPTYAVKLLERIKHLFDVQGVVFVLGIDREQLHHSIQALYGSRFDSKSYLKRFIDLDYKIPDPEPGDYCSYLFRRFNINSLILERGSNDGHYELKTLRFYLGVFMPSSKFSLRDQEQAVARLRVILQTIPKNQFLYPLPLSVLLFLRESDMKLYELFALGQAEEEDILYFFESLPGVRQSVIDSHEFRFALLEAILLSGILELKINSQRFESHKLFAEEQSKKSGQKQYSIEVLEILEQLGKRQFGGSGFIHTISRIAITNNFVMEE